MQAVNKILCIETATTLCSVSVCDENGIICLQELNNGFTHAENLHVFISELLRENKIELSELVAIAVGEGPGSYTGLRIGVSAAKGLAYVLGIPLIAISTLEIMASLVTEQTSNSPGIYCAMLDARRMEVYLACYDENLNEIVKTQAKIIDSETALFWNNSASIYFFGDGMPKCKEIILSKVPNANFIEDIYPNANGFWKLAQKRFNEKQFANVAYFEPNYLKEFYTGTS